jgi:hypothetical protein
VRDFDQAIEFLVFPPHHAVAGHNRADGQKEDPNEAHCVFEI